MRSNWSFSNFFTQIGLRPLWNCRGASVSANPYARVYGLTGVIGSGKSTVAALFRELGAEVLDADELARYVVNPTAPYYAEIRNKLLATFGQGAGPLFDKDGNLNRPLLGKLTFGDPGKVAALNQIMHPAIQQEFALRAGRAGADRLIIYDVPLLFEGGLDKFVKGTILAYAPEAVCVERAVMRARQKGENLPADAVLARLRSQISIEKKRALADYIIDNSGTLEALKPQVAEVYRKLVSL